MKAIILGLIIVLLLVILFFGPRKEGLETVPPALFRVSNTILTPAAPFSDAMDKLTLPASVADEFNEWIEKGFVTEVKDQMMCGGCWAFAVASSLADRIMIATGGKWQPPFGLSEQMLISCGEEMGMQFYQGCEGAVPAYAIQALGNQGLPEDFKCATCGEGKDGGGGGRNGGGVVNPGNTCNSGGSYGNLGYTWFQTKCDESASCSLKNASTCPCSDITNQFQIVTGETANVIPKFKTVGDPHTYCAHDEEGNVYSLDLWGQISQNVIDANVERMKKAIYYEGPITIGIRVTADFFTFWPTASKDNYYKYDGSSANAGGHALVIVGWTKAKDGTPCWIVKNSWGTGQGYGFPDGPKVVDPLTGKTRPKYPGGFYNHVMGIDDSYIEANATAGHPDLTDPFINSVLPSGAKNLGTNWYETLTTRDLYNMTTGKSPSEEGGGNEIPPEGPSEEGSGNEIPPASPSDKDPGLVIELGFLVLFIVIILGSIFFVLKK